MEKTQPLLGFGFLSELPETDQRQLLEWVHMAAYVDSESDLKALLGLIEERAQSKRLCFALGRINQSQQLYRIERLLSSVLYEQWIAKYIERNYVKCDPIFKQSLGGEPIIWSEVFDEADKKEERLFVAEATASGMGEGVTFSAISRASHLGSVLMIAGETIVKDQNLITMLKIFMQHLHLAIVRLAHLAPTVPDSVPLSQREFDIFYWLSKGKTNWEIAIILDISERTVKFHVANIIRKLNANNRTHAIVLGMHLLPPDAQPFRGEAVIA